MSTIKDVAALAGVSPSTVSRTLSNRVFVEEVTRQKVLKAVEELHYQPSLVAKGLREGRTYTLAFLVPDIDSLFYPIIMKRIEHYASLKGYNVILCNNNNSLEQEKSNLEMLGARGIDGILCMTVSDDFAHIVNFQQKTHVPVILVNRFLGHTLSSVGIDNEYGGYLAVKYLLDHGHRKIACIFGEYVQSRSRERCQGCKRALDEYGITDYKRNFIYDVDTTEEAYQRTKDLMKMDDPPTAIFTSMDILAIGVYRALNEMSLLVPEDVSVISFDNIFMARFISPPLTTYDAAVNQVAETCIDRLLAQIDGDTEVYNDVFQGKIVERESVRMLEKNDN